MQEQESVKRVVSEEEIDFRLLIINIIRFTKKHLKTFLLFIVLGLIIGGVSYKLQEPIFEAQMLAYSEYLNSSEAVPIVASWQELLIRNDETLLAKRLNVSPAIIKDIKSIEARTNPSSVGANDPNNKDAFIITVQTRDNTNLDSLQAGIILSLTNTPYLKKMTDVERARLSQLKKRIELEIAQLDSVKRSLTNVVLQSSRSTAPFITEPGNINVSLVELYIRLQDVNKALSFIDTIQIISGFEKFEIPNKRHLLIYLLIGVGVGIITALFLIALRNIWSDL